MKKIEKHRYREKTRAFMRIYSIVPGFEGESSKSMHSGVFHAVSDRPKVKLHEL